MTSQERVIAFLPYIKYGENSMNVRKLQSIMSAMGYSLAVDGDYGLKTKSAVEMLQRVNGIEVNGNVVNAETWEALFL